MKDKLMDFVHEEWVHFKGTVTHCEKESCVMRQMRKKEEIIANGGTNTGKGSISYKIGEKIRRMQKGINYFVKSAVKMQKRK